MTVALELARQGLRVRLIESTQRLGGKATALTAVRTGRLEDHGYHIFPGWYVNTLRLLRELDCDKHLVPFDRYHWLRRGEFPQVITMLEMSSLRNMWSNLHCGVVPWPKLLLSGYFLVDLLSEPFSQRAFLDRISVGGFLRSRFYASDDIAQLHNQFTLQASSIPYYELSAMTLQKVFKGWSKVPSPNLSVLDGDLRTRFIGPFQRKLEEAGVEISKGRDVVRLELTERRISGVVLRDGTRLEDTSPDDIYVLCVPHDEVLKRVNADIYNADQALYGTRPDRRGVADLVQLRSAPMAAWHVYFKRRIPGIPREHVNLIDSRYGLSFVDISQVWEGLDRTVLNCISAYYEPLAALREAEAEAQLRSELFEYLPGVTEDDIECTYLQPHTLEPLFINTLGAWHFRPEPATGVPNLFLAGDYCRSEADLTTMESAIGSALRATAAVLRSLGREPDKHELPIPARPRWQFLLVKYLALPIIVPLALWQRFKSAK